jgi:starvation-inducible DNA-binding protein
MRNDRQLKDNNEEFATQRSTSSDLRSDNQQVTRSLRSTHEVCEQHNDVATVSLLENWIDA